MSFSVLGTYIVVGSSFSIMMLENPFPIFYNHKDAYKLGIKDGMMEVYINTIAKLLYPTGLPRIGRELAEKMGSHFTLVLIPDIKETYTAAKR